MSGFPVGTAAAEGLASCHVCLKVAPEALGRCPRCRARLHLREPNSLQRTLALLATASLLYIPANVLPIMTTAQLGRATGSTILGGVVVLIHHGDYPIAAVIFIASVLVPLSKLFALAGSAGASRTASPRPLTSGPGSTGPPSWSASGP